MIATDRERWRAAQEWLARLLALPADARRATLAQAGLEPELHERVLRLLAAAEAPDPRLEPGSTALLFDPEPPNLLAGRRVGQWELLEEIGRGGMAVVYRARRSGADYEQVAAVKLLGLASLGGGGAARFEQERRVLATLRHPHIAALVDGGMAEDGTPFLAMQLVDGEHIDCYCRGRALDLPARVRLLAQVCEAVAHAHRSLVVHRDIKPANILVTHAGVPVLLDFGIAKLLDGHGEETRTTLRALTPGYAAPEQAAGGAITTATDVFALGSVLKRITDECAPLPADLRNVVAMATRADADRRYRDAAALAADLERWLQRRPVQATPDSAGYRLRLFLRRRRGVAIASSLALLVLVAGVAATLWQAQRATAQARRAEASRDFLVDLFKAADPESSGRDPSLSLLVDRGLQRIDSAFADSPLLHAEMAMLLAQLAMIDGQHARAGELLDAALVAARAGEDRPLQARLLLRRGMLANLRGQHQDAIGLFEQALAVDTDLPALREQVLPALALALENSGQRERAVQLTREALAAVQGQAPADPDQRARLITTAANYEADPARQLRMLSEAADWYDRGSPTPYERMVLDATLGNAFRTAGQRAPAVEAMQRAADAAARLYPLPNPHKARLDNNLASILAWAGHLPQAEAAFARAEAGFRALDDAGSASFAALLNNRAALLRDMDRPEDAIPLLEEALALAERHFGATDFRSALVLRALAQARAATGDRRAEADWQRTWAIVDATDPRRRGDALLAGAMVALDLGDPALALQRLARAEAASAAQARPVASLPIHAARLRGMAAALAGQADEAQRHFSAGEAAADADASGWSAALRLHRAYGDFLRAEHAAAAAADQYRQAIALLQAHGLGPSDRPVATLQAQIDSLGVAAPPR